MKLTTSFIKNMFAQFFSIKKFEDDMTIYWRRGSVSKKSLDEARLEFDLPNANEEDIAQEIISRFKDPKNWKRNGKCKVKNLDCDNPLETGSVEDFEGCCGEVGHIENIDAFYSFVGDKSENCMARSYSFIKSTTSQDYEVYVISDPTDSIIIGWFFHID